MFVGKRTGKGIPSSVAGDKQKIQGWPLCRFAVDGGSSRGAQSQAVALSDFQPQAVPVSGGGSAAIESEARSIKETPEDCSRDRVSIAAPRGT